MVGGWLIPLMSTVLAPEALNVYFPGDIYELGSGPD